MEKTREASFRLANNLLNKCCGKLAFLTTAFGAMNKDGSEIESDEWDGLKWVCMDMANELNEVHELVNQAQKGGTTS